MMSKEVAKTLTYDPIKNLLIHSNGTSISLAKIETDGFWNNLTWADHEFSEIHLGDLFCRLERNALLPALVKFSKLAADNALLKIRIPHPRHNVFLKNIFYQTPLLPETFIEFDQRSSTTGNATKLGLNFELLETAYELDPHWQNSVDQGKITYKDIELISQQANNVVQWVRLDIIVHQSNWVQTNAPVLTAEMKKQLEEQIEMHISRGNHEAAETIRKYLGGNSDT